MDLVICNVLLILFHAASDDVGFIFAKINNPAIIKRLIQIIRQEKTFQIFCGVRPLTLLFINNVPPFRIKPKSLVGQ